MASVYDAQPLGAPQKVIDTSVKVLMQSARSLFLFTLMWHSARSIRRRR
jgi:hypothetical protein